MPYHVVIIEDNLATVRSLSETIKWEELDCQVVGVAFDGESGRELILGSAPHIILTDIRMPGIDGLQMVGDINERYPDAKVIVITGYDQFEYANRAIKLSVFDYILKPIDNSEVERSVRRAVETLKKQKEMGSAVEQALEQARRVRLLSVLINEYQTAPENAGVFGGSPPAFYMMAIRSMGGGANQQALLNHVDALLAQSDSPAISLLLYDTVILLLEYGKPGEFWQEDAAAFAGAVASGDARDVFLGISGLHHEEGAIRKAYFQAKQALWEDMLNRQDDKADGFPKTGNQPKSTAGLDKAIDSLVEGAAFTVPSATAAARSLMALSGEDFGKLRAIVALYSFSLVRKHDRLHNDAVEHAMNEIWMISNEEDARQCVIRLHVALGNEAENQDEHQLSLLTRKALDCIKLHANKGIKLNDIAGELCVSANYLSALIHKETGITFQNHVINTKMEAACVLLADPRILVEEVARLVGYASYLTFYNVFKRNMNMTPSEYRSRLANA